MRSIACKLGEWTGGLLKLSFLALSGVYYELGRIDVRMTRRRNIRSTHTTKATLYGHPGVVKGGHQPGDFLCLDL